MAGNRLGVLDGMRGIAILLVVWFHIWQISWLAAPFPWLQFIPEGGFLGVDIFFFISGFVICFPYVRAKLEGKPRPGWGTFAYRRAIKIVPSYVLSIAIMYAIGYDRAEGSGGVQLDIVTHLLFIHNWFMATYGSINGVLWTLAVEVQFYCIFPLVSIAFLKRPYVTVACMIALALAFRTYDLHRPNDFYFGQLIEQLPAYLDCFGCGMLSAWLYAYFRRNEAAAQQYRALATFGAVLGLVILVALMENLFSIRYNPNGFGIWKVINRTWLALDCGLIAVGSLFAFGWWKKILGNPVLVFCSVISYNWYIYHQVIARELFWHRLPAWAGTDSHFDEHWKFWYSILAFAATLAFAAFATYAFERPILKLPPQWWGNLARKAFNRAR